VPDDIRQVIGKTEIRRSLNTRNHHQAKAAFAIAYAESERFFQQVRSDNSSLDPAPSSSPFSIASCKYATPKCETTSSISQSPLTLSETFLRYVESLALGNKPAHVVRRHTVDYKRSVDRFVTLMGDRRIAEIGQKQIQDFAGKLIESVVKHSNTPLATSSIRLIIARLSSVFSYAVDVGLIDLNPVSASRIHKRLGPSRPKRLLEDNKGYEWTELDRLGRNAMDVRQTVEHLAANSIRVHCLALGGVDLTSPAGKMTMQVLGAVAEFERDLLIERTQQGLKRAKAEGKKLGRPEATDTTASVQYLKAKDMTQTQAAAELGIGIATVKRHWNKGS
jgi:hypothetical protein